MSLDEITSASLSSRCLSCILDKFIDASPDDAPWRTKADYMRSVLRTVADNSETMTAPEIGRELETLLERTYGIKRGLGTEKRHFNELVLGMEEHLRQRIRQSDDPLGFAIRLSMAGNFIDFGQTGAVDDGKLIELVGNAENMELDTDVLAELELRMREARTIAYLTDNCGEIVLDKLVISEILNINPDARITTIVRGKPASNDATMEDAVQVGLDTVCTVIDNGDDVAGTVPSRVNDETRAAIRDSDLVISKGLANYETLSGRGLNRYFLFLCQCALYSDIFGVPLHTGLIVRGVA